MSKAIPLAKTIELIKDETEGDKIEFGEVAEILNSRGFGPLLIAPSLITILPTGAIPTVPTLCASFVILTSVQILMGWKHPWMPNILKNKSFNRPKFRKFAQKTKPYLKWIDQFFKPRLTFLTGTVSKKITAILCILLAISMSLMELIPLLAALPATAILMLGLGLSMRDGLLMIFGYILIASTIFTVPYIWQSL